jgi:hypothetical protein
MHRLGAIISERLTAQRCHYASSFVDQKVGGCKVPIMTVPAGEGDVEFAIR